MSTPKVIHEHFNALPHGTMWEKITSSIHLYLGRIQIMARALFSDHVMVIVVTPDEIDGKDGVYVNTKGWGMNEHQVEWVINNLHQRYENPNTKAFEDILEMLGKAMNRAKSDPTEGLSLN